MAAVYASSKNIGEILQAKHPEVFNGFGKLKGRAVRLHIDPNVNPVAQPIRRTPFSLRSKVEAKIQELVDLDIIEPAQGPTTWVNPVVVVPKSGGGTFAFASTCAGQTRRYRQRGIQSPQLTK